MFTVRNVLVTVRINVLFRKAKVNDEYRVPLRAGRSANQEVLWLNVTVDQQF